MTAPTRDVGSLLLLDYIKVMRGEGKDPIFDTEDVKEMVKHTITLGYEEVSDIRQPRKRQSYNSHYRQEEYFSRGKRK